MKKPILFLASLILSSEWTIAHAQNVIQKNEITVIEDFKSAVINHDKWSGNAVIIDSKTEFNKDIIDCGPKLAKLSVMEKGKVTLVFSKLTVKEASILSFRYRTELLSQFGQTAKFYVNNTERAVMDGAALGWRIERISLPAGEYNLRFETENVRGIKIVGGHNALYIDEITLFPDKISSIVLRPRGEQHTYIGAQGSEKLRFKAEALLPDGFPKQDAGKFVYSASDGAIDKDGFWTPASTGNFTVTATLGNFSVISSRIVVHSGDFLKQPFKYQGTGKTYKGYTGGARAETAVPMPARKTLTITNPQTAEFEADGFFLLEGIVNNPKGKNYARILVRKIDDTKEEGIVNVKNSTPQKLETWYIVKDTFARRIWLPFGRGAYRIELIEFDSALVTTPPNGEGMFRGGSYSQEPLAFTVYNTREETGVDGDGRWIYPSFNIQSDDFRIENLANDITFGIKTDYEKIRAIHDHAVSSLKYDTISFSNSGHSRKMDALSVLNNGTAVCDGYSNLSAALLRCAGIPCRITVNKALLHSWNQVWINNTWKLYDATWDDLVPDKGPDVIQHTYFLLDSLSGGDTRHRGSGIVIIGDVE
ncbi:MAG: transglutaminase domain-containing protein [Spirochaetaceae bacterium]|jgi:hypothetical protein|nr:transglutaminase domain-containing protein [Spirochaetaceae bacterium]